MQPIPKSIQERQKEQFMDSFIKRAGLLVTATALLIAAVQAQTPPRKALFNLGWKFIASNPTGAQATAFNDSTWQAVTVPSSASYDPPYATLEEKHFRATCWYRKHFTCPASAQKVFIHFEGAMQVCDIFINGDSVGSHQHSGYTPFFYDISNYLVRGGANVIALRLNNVNNTAIPPGGNGTDGEPDFFLFSGLYRNVWLLFKDSVYIPDWGQRITTPGTTTSAAVRARTVVANATAMAQSATVTVTLLDASGTTVTTAASTQSVSPASSANFDMTTPTITPRLWSPTTPNMYSLQTIVTVNGGVVDSIMQPVGFRWFSWSTTNGFSLNGSRFELYGMCTDQMMGWIENAMPDSRWFQLVKKAKAMGVNSLRCSHYPRAQAFYDACDKLGMLLYVELPTWMVSEPATLPAPYWPNLDSCAREAVLDGYNHPCIYAWGIANEPNYMYTTYWDTIVGIIHGLDSVSGSGRVTAYAKYSGASQTYTGVDVVGINYATTNSAGKPYLNTESYTNWERVYPRGGSMDLAQPAPGSEATAEVSNMSYVTGVNSGVLAGGHFWCFVDYNSWRNATGEQGVVDRFWVPKGAYFAFQKAWAGVSSGTVAGPAPDYPAVTGTPNKIVLVADTSNLLANGSDVAIVVANLRDSTTGTCIAQACNITWTVTGGATLYPGTGTVGNLTTVTDSALGGRATVLVRTTTTAGPITLTAKSSCGLPAASITLTSTAVTEPFIAASTAVRRELIRQAQGGISALKVVYSEKGALLSFPAGIEKNVQIVNLQGKTIAAYTLRNGVPALVSRRQVSREICFAVWNDGSRRMVTKLNLVQ
jgi:hypothetical protein